jgi:hypothetical protein
MGRQSVEKSSGVMVSRLPNGNALHPNYLASQKHHEKLMKLKLLQSDKRSLNMLNEYLKTGSFRDFEVEYFSSIHRNSQNTMNEFTKDDFTGPRYKLS